MPTLSTNIVRRGEPSRSALSVASLRAVHQLLDEPLVFPDPIALPLLGASTEAALRDDPFSLNDPLSRGLRGALVARSRFVEDELSRCVAAGVRQYLVVGAGLDTFAYRNPYRDEGLRVFEVDHPGTQQWKQQLLAESGIDVPASLTFVPADFERDDLGSALRQAGFHPDQAACVSWMGVTMYLTANAVAATLCTVAGFAPGSRLCFDYRLPVTMLRKYASAPGKSPRSASPGFRPSIPRSCRSNCSIWASAVRRVPRRRVSTHAISPGARMAFARAAACASCARLADAPSHRVLPAGLGAGLALSP